MRRLVLAALIAVSLSACGLSNLMQFGDGAGLKTVGGKEEPITLVAVDGSRCEVTPARYERAKIGDRVWCAWRGHGAAPHPGAPPGGVGTAAPLR